MIFLDNGTNRSLNESRFLRLSEWISWAAEWSSNPTGKRSSPKRELQREYSLPHSLALLGFLSARALVKVARYPLWGLLALPCRCLSEVIKSIPRQFLPNSQGCGRAKVARLGWGLPSREACSPFLEGDVLTPSLSPRRDRPPRETFPVPPTLRLSDRRAISARGIPTILGLVFGLPSWTSTGSFLSRTMIAQQKVTTNAWQPCCFARE